jgi:hypothetical protein
MSVKFGRAQRRKTLIEATKVVMKAKAEGRKLDTVKKQYGFGLVVTNLMLTVMVWRWTFTLYDRRRS